MKLYFLFAAFLFRHYTPDTLHHYPEVRRDVSVVDDYHGVSISDPYRWLENLDSSETRKFVAAQNSVTNTYLNKCTYRNEIKDSIENMMNHTKYGAIKKRGGRYFFLQSTGLENQMRLYVQDSVDGEPRLLLNPDEFSADGTTTIMDFFPSKDGQVLAYKLADKGSDWFSINFMEVESGDMIVDKMAKTKFSNLIWSHDNEGIFYTRYPHLENNLETLETAVDTDPKLYYHIVGTDQDEDVLVAEFLDHPTWTCYAQISDDGKYLMVFAEQDLGPNQIRYIKLDDFFRNNPLLPKPRLIPVVENFLAEYYYVTNQNAIFIFRTNRAASNWRLVAINFDNPSERYWDVIVNEDAKFVLDSVEAINKNLLILNYLQDVKSSLQLRSIDGKDIHKTYHMEPGSVWLADAETDDSELFFTFDSILTPGRIYRMDFSINPYGPELKVFRHSVTPGFNPEDYTVAQKFYRSKDGTQVPMFIAHKKDLQYGNNTPALLYGYGGFNSIMYPYFNADNAVFMKHFNGVYALANIRGGGEYGADWYNGGRLLNKKNTFDDFEAAAQYLVANNYTSSAKLTIQGSSNGGLLVAACVNQRPDLYGAAVAQVGVMDILRFNKFSAGVGWTSDYGSSENKLQFEYMLTYSPLHNVRFPADNNETQYPAMLLTTGDHDDRVVPSHSYKLIAELQHMLGRSKRQTNPLLLQVETDAGHGSGKPTKKQIEEMTNIFSFMCKALNLDFEK